MKKLLQLTILVFFGAQMNANEYHNYSSIKELNIHSNEIDLVKRTKSLSKFIKRNNFDDSNVLVNQNVCENDTFTFSGTGFPLGSGTFPAGNYWLVLVDNATNQIIGNTISNQVRLFTRGPLSIQSFAINASIFPGGILPTNFVYRLIRDGAIFQQIAPVTITIVNNTENITTIVSYQNYTWSNNGQTYTQSGVFTGATTNCVTEKLNLTITNQPITTALDFDGFNDSSAIINNSGLNPTAFTISTWVKWKRSGTAVDFICGKGNETMEIHTGGENSNNIRFIPTPGVYLDGGVNTIEPDTWIHLAAVYNPATSLAKMYINGAEIALNNNGSNSLSTPVASSTNNFVLGSRGNLDYPFKGQLDEFQLWNRALTQAEIQNYMLCAIATTANGLVVNLHFDQGIANGNNSGITLLNDASGNNNNLSLVNFALIGNTSNFIASSVGNVFSSENVTTISACGTYTWNGTTYLNSGIYTGPTTNCVTEKLNLTINNTIWNGTSWSNGLPNASIGALIIGNYAEATDLTACSLEVSENAIVTVPSGFDFTISGKVTVAPTASLTFENDANLIQIENVANVGSIKVKRDATIRRLDYVYWGAPVSGQDLKQFSPQTVSPPIGNSRFYTLDEPSNSFTAIVEPSGVHFIAPKGYMLRAPNNFPTNGSLATFSGVFTGLPNNGDLSIEITNSGVGKGFNMLGNPYPSAINADLFLAQNPGALYFWTHFSQNAASGANYASYTTFGTVAAAGGIAPNGTIAIGQGFLLKKAVAGSGTALFTNTMRTDNNTATFFRSANVEKHRIWLNLSNTVGIQNQILVGYMDGATNGIDVAVDARQIEGGISNIASLIGDEKFNIQARALPFSIADEVPLVFNALSAGNYTIAIDHLDGLFAGGQDIFLKDALTGTPHDIKSSPYDFVSAEGSFANRFSIVYQNTTLGIDSQTIDPNAIILCKENDIFKINSINVIMKNIKVFDIRGRLIYDKDDINAKEASLSGLDAENQILLVQITSDKGLIVTKKAVN